MSTWMMDPTTAYANAGNFWIYFYHTISGKKVRFKGAISQYSDEVTPRFNETNVYGKFDPIYTYQNTSRRITLSWESVAFDLEEAVTNLQYTTLLQSFMYAEYEGLSELYGSALAAPPLLRVNFANLINARNATNASPGAVSSTQGLLCALDRVTFQPDIDAGFFHGKENGGTKTLGIIPKKLDFNCTLLVLHEDTLGWHKGQWRGSDLFGPTVKSLKNVEDLPEWTVPSESNAPDDTDSDQRKPFFSFLRREKGGE